MIFNFTEEKRRSASINIAGINNISITILDRAGKRARWINLNHYNRDVDLPDDLHNKPRTSKYRIRNLDLSTLTGVGVEEVEKGAIKVLKVDRVINSENSVNSLTDILLKI